MKDYCQQSPLNSIITTVISTSSDKLYNGWWITGSNEGQITMSQKSGNGISKSKLWAISKAQNWQYKKEKKQHE